MNKERNLGKVIIILIISAIVLYLIIQFIIGLIVTPKVVDTVNDAKANSIKMSVLSYISAVEVSVATETINTGIMPNGLFNVTENTIYNDTSTLDVSVKGNRPSKGVICVSNGDVISYSIEMAGYTVDDLNGNEQTVTKGSNTKTTLNCN